MADIVDFISITISGIAVVISLNVAFKTRKSEQFRTTFDTQNKLLQSMGEILDLDNQLVSGHLSKEDREKVSHLRQMKIFDYYCLLDFLTLLIKNKEITNESIISYFERTIDNNILFLKEYPDLVPKGALEGLEHFVKEEMVFKPKSHKWFPFLK